MNQPPALKKPRLSWLDEAKTKLADKPPLDAIDEFAVPDPVKMLRFDKTTSTLLMLCVGKTNFLARPTSGRTSAHTLDVQYLHYAPMRFCVQPNSGNIITASHHDEAYDGELKCTLSVFSPEFHMPLYSANASRVRGGTGVHRPLYTVNTAYVDDVCCTDDGSIVVLGDKSQVLRLYDSRGVEQWKSGKNFNRNTGSIYHPIQSSICYLSPRCAPSMHSSSIVVVSEPVRKKLVCSDLRCLEPVMTFNKDFVNDKRLVLNAPADVCVDSTGLVYVSMAFNISHHLICYDLRFPGQAPFYVTEIRGPRSESSMCFDDTNKLYYASDQSVKIVKL
jgi:hypothetical protein